MGLTNPTLKSRISALKSNAFENGPGNEFILGIKQARLFALNDEGDASAFTQTTTFKNSGDWIDQRADAARVLLTNSSGSSQVLQACVIRGKPVTMLSGDEGRKHDGFADWDDVNKYGETTFNFGNTDVIEQTQLNKLADYWWKYHKVAKHIYVLELTGMWQFLQPGEWARLQVGSAGLSEYIDSTVEVYNVRMVRRPGELGQTVVILREVEEAFKNDSNIKARFLASGGTARFKNGTKMNITIASQYYTEAADIYCDGTNDHAEINSVISDMAASGINGTVHLTNGTFNLGGAIAMKSNIILEGEGYATIVEKNADDYAIKGDGASGSELTNFQVNRMRITRNASDTNVKPLCWFDYCDDFEMNSVAVTNSYETGIFLQNCDRAILNVCNIQGFLKAGIDASTSNTEVQITNGYVGGATPTTSSAVGSL